VSYLAALRQRHTAEGRVTWIGVRPERLTDLIEVEEAEVTLSGLQGDHARPGKRALTLIQGEHLPVIASLARLSDLNPQVLRRNLVIEGINLMALRHDRLLLGEAEIRLTQPCSPCSRMEKALGEGAYNAMRGHGGWCAEVVRPGRIARGDRLKPIFD